ncbi:response regulator [Patescibacteria group bacterium]
MSTTQLKKIILVVEDEAPLQKAIKIKLESNNFKVVTARKVTQAIHMLKDLGQIDVIWLDHYLLGKENGLDFVAEVKNNDEWKHIPIFVISNTASQDKVTTYIRLGIDKYYTKADFRLEQIINDIKESLNKRE